MDEILRAFDLATTEQRRQILFDILDRLTDDEMDTVAQIHSWRDKRFDILGKCPVEIQLCIVEQMELQDVCTSMRVCRRWRALLTTSTGPVVYKVLLKWFPTLLPPFCEQQGAMQQRAEVLYRALKAWSITTAARYPVRLTTGFKDFVDQQWPAQQFARLNHDKTYVDLSCGNYPYQSVEEGSPSRQDPVSTFYSDGNLAYQVDGGNVGSLQPIIVHQLPTCQRRTFSSPTYNLVKGNPPKLMAVGDQLVIGVSGRTVLAWTLDADDPVQISLPNTPIGCTTRDLTVYIETQDNQLYVWEDLCGLVEVDTAVPQAGPRPDETTVLHLLQRPNTGECDLPVLHHPLDPTIFFVVAFEPLSRAKFLIYKFAKSVDRYKPVDRFLTNVVTPEEDIEPDRWWSHLIRQRPRRPPGTETIVPFVDIRKIDNRGTYQLLKKETKFDQFIYLTFNTLTEKVGTTTYYMPEREIAFDIAALSLSQASCLWEGQLICGYDTSPRFREESSPILLVLEPQTQESIASAMSVPSTGDIFWANMAKELETSSCRPDIIWRRDLVAQSPACRVVTALYRFRCAWSLNSTTCTFPGRHSEGCWKYLPSGPLREQTYHARRLGTRDMIQVIEIRSPDIEVTAIYRDANFLIMVNSLKQYIVLAVDQDGQWDRVMEAEQHETRMANGQD